MYKPSKIYVFLCLMISCIILVACSQNKPIEKIKTFDDFKQIKVSLKHAKEPSKAQQEKFKKALTLINAYLNDPSFKTMVLKGPNKLNYINPDEPQTSACNENGRASYTFNTVEDSCFNNQEIYSVIKSAPWELNFKIKPSWKFLDCKSLWHNAIGSLEGEIIVTSECYFDEMSVEFLAGFLMHEYLHVIGFKHPYQPSPNRKNTIPYFIGDNAIKAFKNRLN